MSSEQLHDNDGIVLKQCYHWHRIGQLLIAGWLGNQNLVLFISDSK